MITEYTEYTELDFAYEYGSDVFDNVADREGVDSEHVAYVELDNGDTARRTTGRDGVVYYAVSCKAK